MNCTLRAPAWTTRCSTVPMRITLYHTLMYLNCAIGRRFGVGVVVGAVVAIAVAVGVLVGTDVGVAVGTAVLVAVGVLVACTGGGGG